MGEPAQEPTFTQTATQAGGEVDVLFMLDSSNSLSDERAALAAAAPQLANELGQVGPYTFAFSLSWTSDAPSGGFDGSGRLYSIGPNPKVLSSSAMSSADITTAIANTLAAAPPPDPTSDGGEAGLYALNRMLTTHLVEVQSLGFFRNSAALVVVFMSDENDICATLPEGVSPVPDPNGMEATARLNHCSGITSASTVDLMKAVKGNQGAQASGIIYTGPDVPLSGENEIGYGYTDAISLSDGVGVDLASPDFSIGMKNLGNAINALASKIQRRFVLTQGTANPLSIVVKVDGQEVSFQFDEASNSVLLDYAGHPGSIVEIFYRVLLF